MADTYSFDSLLNTTTGMTAIVKNVKKGNTIINVTGVDWFTYAGRTASTIQVNGNSWIQFGASSTKHLEICYRYNIGVIYYIYRQEGILESGKKFLKIRIEGYTNNSSTLAAYMLKYEVFLIEGATLFINVIKRPANSNSIGTSSITDGSTTKTLKITASTAVPIYILVKNAGSAQEISYEKYSDEVVIKTIKIEIISLPDKIKYKKGEPLDSSGLAVKATYNNGTTEEITDYTLSSPDMSSAGVKTVTVTYDEQAVTFDITVIAITKIEITTLPTKLEYRKGDALDTTGLTASTVWTDGSKETLTEGYTVSELDSTETGEKTITVTYQTFTATFVVTVVANTAGIRISHYPDKIYYKIGDQLNTSGLSVVKYREDGSETEVFRYNVSGFDSSKTGNNTVRVFYTEVISSTESETFSTTFSVKITNDGQNPFEENLDPINITVHWINGEFEDLTNENIQQSSVTLQESICSESYFIFGGCVCNQITFSAHHKQFDGTGEEYYPTGKIEVYLERNKTKIKIFTGEIDTAERVSNSLTRNFVAYDYLYKLRNTDIAWWYKNRTVDSQMVFTQKQFRDALFAYLGIKQVETTLEYDNASVPNTNVSNEINVINIIKDLCLQNSVFGWMNRDGKFEYLKLPENSYQFGTTVSGVKIYKYFEAQIHLDTFKSFYAKEGRIWFPQEFMADPYPGIFSSGEPSAQEAYEKNIYYNRNSFFVGNQDWLNMAFNADEYGVYTRSKPLVNLCYGTTSKLDPSHLYRAQEYTAEVDGNPFNMVGQTVELRTIKYLDDGTELPVLVNSYIMSRTLKISGGTSLIDTYSAKNSPYNGNNQQLGKYTPEISATVNQTRSELPTISYEEFSDGTDIAMLADTGTTVKKAQLRCIKRIKKADYDTLVAAGNDRKDTLYFTYEED